MSQPIKNGLGEIDEVGMSMEAISSRRNRSIGALTLDLSDTTISSPRLSSIPGTPQPTTPKNPPAENPVIKTVLDREQRAVSALLTRFKALVTLAAEPIQDGATKEVAAAQGLQMDVEGSALVRAAEDLLQLTRQLKELWLFGPLRDIKEGEGEGQMDEDSQKVGELVEAVLKKAMDRPSAS